MLIQQIYEDFASDVGIAHPERLASATRRVPQVRVRRKSSPIHCLFKTDHRVRMGVHPRRIPRAAGEPSGGRSAGYRGCLSFSGVVFPR